MLPDVTIPRVDTGLFNFGSQPVSRSFIRQYRNDPVAFVHDCYRWKNGEGPTVYQDAILADLPIYKRVCARGPHGLGKTALNSWAIHWFALTRDGFNDWKIPTTASAWRQLQKYLWPEVHKWTRALKWNKLGREPFEGRKELLDLSLKLTTGEAFALASNVPDLIEGAHAEELLYIFDESKVIEPETWNSAEGAFSTGNPLWLATSTPGEPNGTFYDIQARKPGYEDWKVHKVTLEDCIKAGRISPEWAESRRVQWGENSAAYQNRVLGEFATSEEDGVIPLRLIEQANELWKLWDENGRKGDFVALGADISDRGGDKNVLAHRYDVYPVKGDPTFPKNFSVISQLDRSGNKDVMQTTGDIAGILRAKHGKAIVDAIGVGAGVVPRLREQGFEAIAFVASRKTNHLDRAGELGFVNMRSAAWWNLREMLEDGTLAIPPDDQLTGDLTAPHWRVLSGGKIQVESKDTIRERIRRSTDDGDAVVQVMFMYGTESTWSDVEDLGQIDDYESRWT